MAFFEWKSDYSVGIKQLDEQHREIVTHLNNLYDTMKKGKGRDTLDNVLNGLVQYTKKHFSKEESLMRLYKFPGYDEHIQKHKKMAERVVQLKQKFDTGEISSPVQITNFLKEWLSKHIMGTDRAYGAFLNERGVR